jgi:hypothetical protein
VKQQQQRWPNTQLSKIFTERYFAIYIYSMYAGIYDISDREKKIFKLVIYLTAELGCSLFFFYGKISKS